MKRRITFAALLVLLAISLIMGCARPTAKLTIGLVPSSQPETLQNNFMKIKNYLEQQTGYKIEVFVPQDYAGLSNAMKDKKVDIAWFGAFSYIAAESEMKLEPLVIQQRVGSGTGYHSLIVARKDAGLATIDDLKGKKFTFVDPGSTSGFVVPYSLFQSRGLDYTRFFNQVIYSGTHDKVLMDVLEKRADAGALEDLTLNKMIESGKVKQEEVTILWKSSLIPGSPFVARADIPKAAKNKFRQAMITMHEKAPDAIQAFDSKIEKYVVFDDSIYNEIRNIATLLGKQFMIDNFLRK